MHDQPKPNTATVFYAPERPCRTCGAAGPFYASQPHRYQCVPCFRAARRARWQRQGDPRQHRRVAWLRLRDAATLTRYERRVLLRTLVQPGQKLCPWCETIKPATAAYFSVSRREPDGWQHHCKDCQQAMGRLAAAQQKGARAS